MFLLIHYFNFRFLSSQYICKKLVTFPFNSRVSLKYVKKHGSQTSTSSIDAHKWTVLRNGMSQLPDVRYKIPSYQVGTAVFACDWGCPDTICMYGKHRAGMWGSICTNCRQKRAERILFKYQGFGNFILFATRVIESDYRYPNILVYLNLVR
jgi:hypothetical protein